MKFSHNPNYLGTFPFSSSKKIFLSNLIMLHISFYTPFLLKNIQSTFSHFIINYSQSPFKVCIFH